MTVEQKPGCGVCFRNPRETLSATEAVIKTRAAARWSSGTSLGFRTTPRILAEQGYSIPEITAKLAKQHQSKSPTITTEAAQMEDSTL